MSCCSQLRCLSCLAAVILTPPVFPAQPDCTQDPYECAAAAAQSQQLPEAVNYLRAALLADPGSLKALNLLGIVLTEQGKPGEANQAFQQAIEINADFYPARKNLAANEFKAGRLAEAKEQFEAVLRLKPEDDVAQAYLGEIAFSAHDCTAAVAHYENGQPLARESPLVFHFAECLLTQGNAPKAAEVLSGLPADQPDQHFEAGLLLARFEQHEAAAGHFGLARADTARSQTAGYNQLLMLVLARDFQAGAALADELVKQGYRQGDFLNLAARAHLGLGHSERAYELLRGAVQSDPRNEENYLDLANICASLNKPDLGLTILEIGLRRLPDSLRLLLHRGILYAIQAKMQQAEQDFKTVVASEPQQPLPYVSLALVWMHMGKLDQALELLSSKLDMKEQHFALPYLLGQALMRTGPAVGSKQEQAAVEAFQRSIALNPNFPRPYVELGKIYVKHDQTEPAIEEFEKALQLDPKERAAAYHLARAYRKVGREEAANRLFASVPKMNDAPEDDSKMAAEILQIITGSSARKPASLTP